ncbi:MAG: hypothetical protein HeimC3_17120 [Candidatus Heimdallarchaeota archaeon LC_3]|nr:MAG: hypothetical protein HeimC3_17120 [Candidatus Heimdallarchaeota archaeon LC_3]
MNKKLLIIITIICLVLLKPKLSAGYSENRLLRVFESEDGLNWSQIPGWDVCPDHNCWEAKIISSDLRTEAVVSWSETTDGFFSNLSIARLSDNNWSTIKVPNLEPSTEEDHYWPDYDMIIENDNLIHIWYKTKDESLYHIQYEDENWTNPEKLIENYNSHILKAYKTSTGKYYVLSDNKLLSYTDITLISTVNFSLSFSAHNFYFHNDSIYILGHGDNLELNVKQYNIETFREVKSTQIMGATGSAFSSRGLSQLSLNIDENGFVNVITTYSYGTGNGPETNEIIYTEYDGNRWNEEKIIREETEFQIRHANILKRTNGQIAIFWWELKDKTSIYCLLLDENGEEISNNLISKDEVFVRDFQVLETSEEILQIFYVQEIRGQSIPIPLWSPIFAVIIITILGLFMRKKKIKR